MKKDFAGVLIVGALLLLAACDPSSAPAEGADSTGTSTASSRQRGASQGDSLAARLIARTDSIFETVSVLSAGEKHRLRRYLQDEHMACARRFGVDPVPDRRAAADLMSRPVAQNGGVRLQTNDFYIIDPRMDYAAPVLVPYAAHLLERIGRRFQRAMLAEGLPPYRFILTNVLRTGSDQAQLRGNNVNAAQGQSTHEYGTTFDIFYGRFHYAAVHDSLALSAPRPIRFDDARMWQRLRRAYRRFGETHARKIKAILGRTLLAMQNDGLLLAIYEREQDVFHITVADDVAAPAERAFSTVQRQRMSADARRFYAHTESQLADIGNDIDDLEQQAQGAGSKALPDLKEKVATLRDEHKALQQALSKLDRVAPSKAQSLQTDLQRKRAKLEAHLEQVRIEAMPEKRAVQHHVDTRLQEMNRAINQLDEQVANADAGIKEQYQKRVADLSAQYDMAQSRLRALRGASAQAFPRQRSRLAKEVARLSTQLAIVSGDFAGAIHREG